MTAQSRDIGETKNASRILAWKRVSEQPFGRPKRT